MDFLGRLARRRWRFGELKTVASDGAPGTRRFTLGEVLRRTRSDRRAPSKLRAIRASAFGRRNASDAAELRFNFLVPTPKLFALLSRRIDVVQDGLRRVVLNSMCRKKSGNGRRLGDLADESGPGTLPQ